MVQQPMASGARGKRVGNAKLTTIEALRGVAAVSVVLYHVARHLVLEAPWPALMKVTQAGHAGVDLFFVISGFIIIRVHRGDIGRRDRLVPFLTRRFHRIWPMYWLALAVTLAMRGLGGHDAPAASVLWSATLLPSFEEPLLGPAWTLQFEAVFYVAVAVLIVNRIAGAAIFAGWLGLIAAAAVGGLAVVPQISGGYGIEFFFGMAAAEATRLGRLRSALWIAGLGAGLFVAAMAGEDAGLFDGYGMAARLFYGLAAGLLLFGAATAEQQGALRAPRWMQRLGGASFSIYLFQFVFIGLAWKIAPAWLPLPLQFATLLIVALAGGMAMSALVEQKLQLMLRRRPPAVRAGLVAQFR